MPTQWRQYKVRWSGERGWLHIVELGKRATVLRVVWWELWVHVKWQIVGESRKMCSMQIKTWSIYILSYESTISVTCFSPTWIIFSSHVILLVRHQRDHSCGYIRTIAWSDCVATSLAVSSGMTVSDAWCSECQSSRIRSFVLNTWLRHFKPCVTHFALGMTNYLKRL